MVDGNSSPGTCKPLCGLFCGAAVPPARSAHPICRLCLLAAREDEGRVTGKPELVLEKGIGRGPLHPGIAHRQATSCYAKLPGRDGNLSSARTDPAAAENF